MVKILSFMCILFIFCLKLMLLLLLEFKLQIWRFWSNLEENWSKTTSRTWSLESLRLYRGREGFFRCCLRRFLVTARPEPSATPNAGRIGFLSLMQGASHGTGQFSILCTVEYFDGYSLLWTPILMKFKLTDSSLREKHDRHHKKGNWGGLNVSSSWQGELG